MRRALHLALAIAMAITLSAPVSPTPASAFQAAPAKSADVNAPLSPAKQQIAKLFDRWNASLQTGDPAQVAANYAPDAVLVPTVSNKVRDTPALIEDYFHHFLELKPKGYINERHIRIYGPLAVDSGLYTFDITDKKGQPQKVGARYTFVYRRMGATWKIIEHHSSKLPE